MGGGADWRWELVWFSPSENFPNVNFTHIMPVLSSTQHCYALFLPKPSQRMQSG